MTAGRDRLVNGHVRARAVVELLKLLQVGRVGALIGDRGRRWAVAHRERRLLLLLVLLQ